MTVPAYMMVRVPVRAVHDLYSTGYFANHDRGGKVHVVHRSTGRPVCGQTTPQTWYQWCAWGIREEWIECGKCERIIAPLLSPVVAGAAA